MLFNSIEYAWFLPIVFILYWTLPSKLRWVLLLLSSYYFYMSWNVKYVVLIATTTVVSYICAIAIEKTDKRQLKQLALATALIVSLGILYIFKYFNFTMSIASQLFSFNPVYLKFLLPVGISFYTFQTLSYVIDVYNGSVKAEKHLGVYATFVSFFPQLVAGPIERSSNLLPQIKNENSFDYNVASEGIVLIIWGLYKKVVIADNLAVCVDKVYGDVSSYTGCCLLIATLFFTFQIYCDFSGYSDIARGSAKLFNIELMENFKSPYFSSGLKDFWNRWHISLSSWFRDYVYIPLGGNRVSKMRHAFNLFITFLVSGLWHGANLTFVFWGALHGVGQIIENSLKIKKYDRIGIHWLLRVVITFVFVMFAWIFFRAASILDAVYVIRHMFDGVMHFKAYIVEGVNALGIGARSDIRRIIFVYFCPLMIYDFLSLQNDVCKYLSKLNVYIKYSAILLITVVILAFGYVGKSSFVYFQF